MLEAKVHAADQREAALNIKERVLDTAEDKLDEREITIDHRDNQLLVREEDVVHREGILDRVADKIGKLISNVADRLGARKLFAAYHLYASEHLRKPTLSPTGIQCAIL